MISLRAISRAPLRDCFAMVVVMCLAIGETQAATLTWDANGATAPNPSDGSGTWLTASNWWNGTNNVSGAWTGSAPDIAVIGAGAAGGYNVTLGAISASNVIFNTSGYSLAGGSLALSSSSG